MVSSMLDKKAKAAIVEAIVNAEKHTTGEIRVHVENQCKGDPLFCATAVFHRIGMHKTLLRNGVLFYVAVKDRKFAVAGDEGIHKNVPEGFWDSVRDKVLENFTVKKFTEGLCEGISMTGRELEKYFPRDDSDKNELSNEITFGKK